MKNQALFSSKDKSKKLKSHLLQFLFGALRVKYVHWTRRYRITESNGSLKIFSHSFGLINETNVLYLYIMII